MNALRATSRNSRKNSVFCVCQGASRRGDLARQHDFAVFVGRAQHREQHFDGSGRPSAVVERWLDTQASAREILTLEGRVFLELCYRRLLGRTADPGGLARWTEDRADRSGGSSPESRDTKVAAGRQHVGGRRERLPANQRTLE